MTSSADRFLLLINNRRAAICDSEYEILMNQTIKVPVMSAGFSVQFYLGHTHGFLMVLAWIFFSPIGTIAARYLRNNHSKNSIFKLPNWFQIHRNFNYAAVILSVLAMMCIWLANGFSWTGPWPGMKKDMFGPGSMHSLFGAVCIFLAIIQPIAAYFRPKPNSSSRDFFNNFHRVAGVSALLFAMIAMFIVARNFAKRFYSPMLVWVAYLVYCAVLIAAIIYLETKQRSAMQILRCKMYEPVAGKESDSESIDEKDKSKSSTRGPPSHSLAARHDAKAKHKYRASVVFVAFIAAAAAATLVVLVNMILRVLAA